MGERDAHHLGAVRGGGREVVRHLGLLQAEDGTVELEGKKAEFVHVDEATVGDDMGTKNQRKIHFAFLESARREWSQKWSLAPFR